VKVGKIIIVSVLKGQTHIQCFQRLHLVGLENLQMNQLLTDVISRIRLLRCGHSVYCLINRGITQGVNKERYLDLIETGNNRIQFFLIGNGGIAPVACGLALVLGVVGLAQIPSGTLLRWPN
jgi:hypothetical protein